MSILFDKYKENTQYLIKKLQVYNTEELGKLTDITYRSNSIKFCTDILHDLNISKNILDQYYNETYKNKSYMKLLQNQVTIFNMSLVHFQWMTKNKELFLLSIIQLTIRFHSNYSIRVIKYMDENIQNLQFSKLYTLHQYVREKSVTNFIKRISVEMSNKYFQKPCNENSLVQLAYESRTRVVQPFKKFQEQYYQVKSTTMVNQVSEEEMDYNMDVIIQKNYNNMVDQQIKSLILSKPLAKGIKIQNQYTFLSEKIQYDIISQLNLYFSNDNDIFQKFYYQMLEQNQMNFDTFFNMNLQLNNIKKNMQVKYTSKKDYLKLTVIKIVNEGVLKSPKIDDNLKRRLVNSSLNTQHAIRLSICYYYYYYLLYVNNMVK